VAKSEIVNPYFEDLTLADLTLWMEKSNTAKIYGEFEIHQASESTVSFKICGNIFKITQIHGNMNQDLQVKAEKMKELLRCVKENRDIRIKLSSNLSLKLKGAAIHLLTLTGYLTEEGLRQCLN